MKNASKIIFSSLFILFFSLLSFTAQQQPAPVKASQVKGTIYEVKGGRGANCGFIIGEKEVLVIDAKMDKESAELMFLPIAMVTMSMVLLASPKG